MKLLKGYDKVQDGEVCKLKKRFYGLKQASRAWNIQLKGFLKTLGYTHTYSDYSLFIKVRKGKFTLLLAYVDDFLKTRDDLQEISRVRLKLHEEFIKDLGKLR